MNPEIEKFMEEEQNNEHTETEEKQEVDISDEQLAKNWKNYKKMAKIEHKYEKLLKKHKDYELSPKKTKFLKPQY